MRTTDLIRLSGLVLAAATVTTAAERAPLVSAAATDSRADQARLIQYLRSKRLPAERTTTVGQDRVLRVVYFCPKGTAPQKDYRARLERIMFDVRDFYRTGMAAYGVENWVLPLELVDERLRVHLVRGREGEDAYDYKSGNKIMAEIKAALGDEIRFGKEHLIVFHGLCAKQPDGSYRVHAPYYGSAARDNQSGVCHAADCELLDPRHFKDTTGRIRYTEHTGTFDQTLADFNTKYIGGVAHELGHALGLPHVSEAGQEGGLYGTALMGAGNHTYRRELWNPKRRGAFLTMASAVRLLVHPLHTGCAPTRTDPEMALSELAFVAEGRELVARGQVTGSPRVAAVIAHVDPEGRSDYDSDAGVGVVSAGRFEVRLPCWKPGVQELKIDIYNVNGAHRIRRFPFTTNNAAEPDAARLMGDWLVQRAERTVLDGDVTAAKAQAAAALARDDVGPAAKQALRYLLALCEPLPDPVPISAVKEAIVNLADVRWESAEVGWGKPARNQYWHNATMRDAVLLNTGGTFFEKGLYAHAPSGYVFAVDGRFSRFTATAGLQQGAASVGSGVFIVRGDGKELYRSKRLGPGETAIVDVEIAGIGKLELNVESGKDDNACCWTIWGAPRVRR